MEKSKEKQQNEKANTSLVHHNKRSVSKLSLSHKDTSGESSPESDEEDELAERGRQDQNDLPSEYWQIQKLVKYLKVSCQDLEA